MDCAGFEERLAQLFGEEPNEPEREALVDELRAHATACPRCGGSADLVGLLALPRDERDLVEPPADSYWDELQASIVRRAALAERRGRRQWRIGWAAAAAVLIALTGLWLVRGPQIGRPGAPTGEIPVSLDALLQDAEPETARAGIDFLAGLPGVRGPAMEHGIDDGIVPLIEDIDAEDRDALMDWLSEREPVDREVES